MTRSLTRIVALAVLLTISDQSLAGDAPVPVVVLIATRAHLETSEAIVRACQAQMNDLRIALEVHWVDKAPAELAHQEAFAQQIARKTGALAVLWYDIGDVEHAYLYLVSSRSDGILARRLQSSTGSDLDAMTAVIARSSVSALLEGGRIGVGSPMGEKGKKTRAAPGAQAEIPASGKSQDDDRHRGGPAMQRSVASGYRLAMEVSYFYQGVSADHPYAGGAFLAVNVSILDRWYGFAGYLLTDRIENEAHGVQLDLERSPFLLGTGFCFALKRTCLGGLFALGLEIIEEQVRTSTSHLEPVESNTELGLSLMPAIRLDVKIIGPLSIYALAGARIELNRYRYTVNDGVDHKVIFEAWPVQPVGMAGVTTALF